MALARDDIAPILLLNANHANATVDKKVLRETGAMRIETFISGEEAARYLARDVKRAQETIVICNQRLCDMSGEQFCDIIRLHPRFFALPILLVVPSGEDRDHLLALGCGASDVIARPYSVQAMRDVLHSLTHSSAIPPLLRKAQKEISLKAFESCLINFKTLLRPVKHSPEDYFKVGMHCLSQKKWNSAITAFHMALTSQVIRGEAELGIALAYRGKGDKRQAELWMKKATETFITAGRWHLARTIYARLEKSDKNGHNPFFAQAKKLIGQREYDKAAETLTEGIATVPHNVIAERLADICTLADSPEMMYTSLQEALVKRSADFDEISASIDREMNRKMQEQKEREERAREERTDQLSRRIAAMRAKEQEEKSEEMVAILPPLGEDLSHYDFMDNELALRPLPQKNKDPGKATGKKKQMPRFSDTSVRSPRFKDILEIIRQTWAMMRHIHR